MNKSKENDMRFKKYVKESSNGEQKSNDYYKDRLSKAWSLIESLNKLNKIPDTQKTEMANKLEEAIRNNIKKD